jgi:hypothetical protein
MDTSLDGLNGHRRPPVDDVTELLGKLVGRLEENHLVLHLLVALLEERGMLAPGALDDEVARFLREQGREYFVEEWGPEVGEGLYQGLASGDLR